MATRDSGSMASAVQSRESGGVFVFRLPLQFPVFLSGVHIQKGQDSHGRTFLHLLYRGYVDLSIDHARDNIFTRQVDQRIPFRFFRTYDGNRIVMDANIDDSMIRISVEQTYVLQYQIVIGRTGTANYQGNQSCYPNFHFFKILHDQGLPRSILPSDSTAKSYDFYTKSGLQAGFFPFSVDSFI